MSHLISHRQLVGSREAAIETVLLLRQVVSTAKFSSINQLVGMVKGVGRRLVEAQPKGKLTPPEPIND
jgi:translation initiation factor eIF-2B subunit beta